MITPHSPLAVDLVDVRCPRGHLLGRHNPLPAGVTVYWQTKCDRCGKLVMVELSGHTA